MSEPPESRSEERKRDLTVESQSGAGIRTRRASRKLVPARHADVQRGAKKAGAAT
jgi:hypothetical protein